MHLSECHVWNSLFIMMFFDQSLYSSFSSSFLANKIGIASFFHPSELEAQVCECVSMGLIPHLCYTDPAITCALLHRAGPQFKLLQGFSPPKDVKFPRMTWSWQTFFGGGGNFPLCLKHNVKMPGCDIFSWSSTYSRSTPIEANVRCDTCNALEAI